MKVWVVTHQWDPQNNDVEFVFDNEHKAKAVCEKLNQRDKDNGLIQPCNYWGYVEMTVT